MPDTDFTLSHVESENEGITIYLAGSAKRDNVVSIRQRIEAILAATSKGKVVVVDLSGLKGFDSATLSLWLCLLRAAALGGISLRVSQPPAPLIGSAKVVGLASIFVNS